MAIIQTVLSLTIPTRQNLIPQELGKGPNILIMRFDTRKISTSCELR